MCQIPNKKAAIKFACINGFVSEAYYKEIPEHITEGVIKRLPDEFIDIMQRFYGKFIEK